jgi:hypothetical protein
LKRAGLLQGRRLALEAKLGTVQLRQKRHLHCGVRWSQEATKRSRLRLRLRRRSSTICLNSRLGCH